MDESESTTHYIELKQIAAELCIYKMLSFNSNEYCSSLYISVSLFYYLHNGTF